tara:strand:+ start:531 stop:1745 length:1215 start_codon:yes stop_codon:yes gene_type:complete
MPKRLKELSAAEVRRLAKSEQGFYGVGGVTGLYLQVKFPAVAWVLYTTVGDKRRKFGLGGFPTVSLEQAREKARAAHKCIEEGVDPSERKRALQQQLKSARVRRVTFESIALDVHKSKSAESRSKTHKDDWFTSLFNHAFPIIGQMPINEIKVSHVLQVLEPIWHTKTETATRVRQRMEAVFSRAKTLELYVGENPARWKEHLENLLPRPAKIQTVVPHPSMPWREMPKFFAQLCARPGNRPAESMFALQMLILTWSRTSEILQMERDEVDIDERLWTIPATRMKNNKEHQVPLSKSAIRLYLEARERHQDSKLVFPGRGGKPMSSNALRALCQRIVGSRAVPHGMRSSAKDWARNLTSYSDEVSELQLSHVDSDATRAAYARDKLIDLRRGLVSDWDNFLNDR